MRRILSALMATLALVAGACGGDEATSQPVTEVTVILDWTPNTNHTGLYVAREKGWYAEQGLAVTIIQPGSADVLQAVAGGQAQFGVSVQEAVIPAREQGVPVVSIAAIIQHNTSSLMSLAADNIVRPRDLVGKTYGGFGGPLETALISKLVSCDGGDPSAVKFVEVGNVDYLVGMDQDRFDVAWVFDGWDGLRASEVEHKAVNHIRLADHFDCIPDWYTPLLVTNEEMISGRPDVVRKFMAATAAGYEYAMTNPDDAASTLLAAAPELDSRLVMLSAEYLATRYVEGGHRWGMQDAAVWLRFEVFLREAGLTQEPVDVSKAYTNDFLRIDSVPGASVDVRALSHRFDGPPPVDVLANVSFRADPGEFVSLIGPSGCGKSTLLRMLAGLTRPLAGDVLAGGRSVAGQPGHAAYMPQRDLLMPWRRVLANATLGAEVAGVPKRAAQQRALELLERFGLKGFERAWPAQLSGGMRQRLALLRTFLSPRGLLLLDEPFGALDAITRRDMQAWLEGVWLEDRRTVVFVTHDIDEALALADRVLVMSARPGRIIEEVVVPFTRPRGGGRTTDERVAILRSALWQLLETGGGVGRPTPSETGVG